MTANSGAEFEERTRHAFSGDRTAIIAALEDAVATRRFDSPILHAAVARFARRSRQTGVPPEQFVIRLKGIVRDQASSVGDWWRAVLTDRSVRWGVEAYYDLTDIDEPATGLADV
jgi:hypothetical protein